MTRTRCLILARLWCGVAGSLYFFALLLPTVEVRLLKPPGEMYGWEVLGFLWLLGLSDANLAFSWLGLCWLANPMMWSGIALLSLGRYGWGTITALLATLLATIPLIEGGRFLSGYYVWLGSMGVVALGGFTCAIVSRVMQHEYGVPLAVMGTEMFMGNGSPSIDSESDSVQIFQPAFRPAQERFTP
jgi:hypothetical protein